MSQTSLGSAAARSNPVVAANYQYWRDHGAEWTWEYAHRKKKLVYYHLQEIMLADYMRHSTPSRVLEYGSGNGRHLRYLSRIPGLDVYGYDQSQTMVDGCRVWATQAWLDAHVVVGSPVGQLPYPNKHFDIVFTSEVLVHVTPDDLAIVLSELTRVCRWQIVHLEPSSARHIISNAHQGCWYHDLAAIYDKLGFRCDRLDSGFAAQSPWRVLLGDDRRPYDWDASILELLRSLETDIQHTLDQGELVSRRLELQTKELADSRAVSRAYSESLDTVTAQLRAERRRAAELDQQLQAERAIAEKARLELLDQFSLALGVKDRNRALRRAKEARKEIEHLTLSPAYRLGRRLRRSWPMRLYRRMRYSDSQVVIRALGRKNPRSHGTQVWLLGVATSQHPEGIPLRALDYTEQRWRLVDDQFAPYGQSLMADGRGVVVLYGGADPNLRLDFLMHDWSGIMEITVPGKFYVFDLYAEHHHGISIYPLRSPIEVRSLESGAYDVRDSGNVIRASGPGGFCNPIPSVGKDYDKLLSVTPRRFERIYDAPALMAPQERVLLYSLVFALKPRNCLEIGMNRGGSASIIVAALDDLNANGRLVCVDPEKLFSAELWATIQHRTMFIHGASPEALNGLDQIAGGKFEFVNIDGLHDYNQVLADARGVMPLLADEAYVLFHDAYYVSVRDAIDQILFENPTALIDLGIISRTPNPAMGNPDAVWGGIRVVRYRRN